MLKLCSVTQQWEKPKPCVSAGQVLWDGGGGLHYKSFIRQRPASQISGHNGNVWDRGSRCCLSGGSLCRLCMYDIFEIDIDTYLFYSVIFASVTFNENTNCIFNVLHPSNIVRKV